ncbi:hypothetical protein NC652_011019 [Populus alba x Populus x berolinensis]|nr:hypothetical protein NC652_011019 [Populus alba x Populus x berolinensis]
MAYGLDLGNDKGVKKITTASLEVERAVDLLRNAERPLIVFGKGAAYARAENELKRLVESTGIPFLPTPMEIELRKPHLALVGDAKKVLELLRATLDYGFSAMEVEIKINEILDEC